MTVPHRIVWVVDDSQTDAERARRILSPTYQVELFPDGASALERLSAQKVPDVLLLDWVMPGMNGLEVCRYIRSEPRYFQMKILLLTAQRETSQIVEGLAAGADDYLPKPYAEAEMTARVGALVRSREMTERAEVAETVAQSLLEGSPDALLAWDHSDGRISFVNPEAVRVLKRPASEMLGAHIEEILPQVPQAKVHLKDRPFATLADFILEERIYSPTVREVPSKRGSQTILSLHDVTERRQLDARRLDFYSIIAHDLRGPLAAVLMRTGIITRGRHGPPPAGLIADVQRIETSVRSMVSLINDFLELARLENTAFGLQREPIDLGELVQATMEELRPLLEAGKLTAADPVITEPIPVLGDRRRLTQVLNNLIGNAIKFTPEGGTIRTTIDRVSGGVRVSVRDTGRGIPLEAREKLFERYTRASNVGQTAGTGLGLMIVREIVEAHGGVVGVDSVPGEGSNFWFTLPTGA